MKKGGNGRGGKKVDTDTERKVKFHSVSPGLRLWSSSKASVNELPKKLILQFIHSA